MKRKSLSSISILIITMLAACGPAPTPTLSVTDIQNTAFPMVMTQYALTKAAIPSATPVPTSLPTLAPPPDDRFANAHQAMALLVNAQRC